MVKRLPVNGGISFGLPCGYKAVQAQASHNVKEQDEPMPRAV